MYGPVKLAACLHETDAYQNCHGSLPTTHHCSRIRLKQASIFMTGSSSVMLSLYMYMYMYIHVYSHRNAN